MQTLESLARGGLTSGFLWRLPRESADRLVADGLRVDLPAGAALYREDEAPRIVVVLTGILRVIVRGGDGRQVTVRHVYPGEVVGLALLAGGPASVSVEAVGPACVLALRTELLAELMRTDPEAGRVCAAELAHQVFGAFEEAASQSLLPLRERIGRALLNVATREPGGELVAHVSQQSLADEVGTAREVVARVLHDLRGAGLIRTARDRISIVDPAGVALEFRVAPPALDPLTRANDYGKGSYGKASRADDGRSVSGRDDSLDSRSDSR